MGQNAKDSPECAKALVKKGCNLESVDNGGNTPLCIACSTYSPDSVKLLLKYGANKYHSNFKGFNPFHQALSRGNIDCAELVLESGYDIKTKAGELSCMKISIKYNEMASVQ